MFLLILVGFLCVWGFLLLLIFVLFGGFIAVCLGF